MGRAISEVLPFAVVVAISPLAIVAIILVLFSARARVNSILFTGGWIVGVAVVGTVIYLLADAGDVSSVGHVVLAQARGRDPAGALRVPALAQAAGGG